MTTSDTGPALLGLCLLAGSNDGSRRRNDVRPSSDTCPRYGPLEGYER